MVRTKKRAHPTKDSFILNHSVRSPLRAIHHSQHHVIAKHSPHFVSSCADALKVCDEAIWEVEGGDGLPIHNSLFTEIRRLHPVQGATQTPSKEGSQ